MGELNYRPDDVQALKAMFDDLRRRILALETAPALTFASQKGGSFTILDPATGNPLVVLGQQPAAAGGGYGLSVRNANGRYIFAADTVAGQGAPYLTIPMSPGTASSLISATPFFGTTAVTSTECYLGDFWASGGSLQAAPILYVGAGVTSAAWAVTVQETACWANNYTVGTETVLVSGTATVTGQVWGTVTAIPAAAISAGRTGTDPRGSTFRVRYKANVAAGAGSVSLAPTDTLFNFS